MSFCLFLQIWYNHPGLWKIQKPKGEGMAYDIFFCDDENEASLLFLPEIRKVFSEYTEDIRITFFKDSVKLLDHILNKSVCDVLFLDIDMPCLGGINLCKELEKRNYHIPVVFLSNMEHRVYETFEFQTVFFLRKRLFYEEIGKVARKLFQNRVEEEKNILFANGRQSHLIPIKEIRYLEIINQTLYIHLPLSTISLRFRMEKAEEMLKDYGFLRVHKGYLVNGRKISSIEREDLHLADGTRIPVSRRRYNSIKEEFLRLTTREIINGESL